MWRIGLILHAASYILWMLVGIVVIMLALDGCARFVIGGIQAL